VSPAGDHHYQPQGSINAGVLAYDRTFDLLGRMASAAIILPYFPQLCDLAQIVMTKPES
jgi:hypothetical protein